MEGVEDVTYYHPDITRDEASEILRQTRTRGAFLVRNSESKLRAKVLSVLTDKDSGAVSSYRLTETAAGKVYLAVKNDKFYDSLQELIADYLSGREVLPDKVKLIYPVANNDQPIYVHLPKNKEIPITSYKERSIRKAKLVKDNVVDFVTCLICLEIADDAMETSCCHKIYCRDCLSKVESRLCPTCRQEFKMIISHTTRRIIGSLPASCPNAGCSLESTVSEIKVHERKCEFLKRACLIPDCQVSCLKRDLGKHLVEAHEDLVIRCMERCYLKQSEEEFDAYVYTEQERVAPSDRNNRTSRVHTQDESSSQRMLPRSSRLGAEEQRSRQTPRSSAVSMEDEYDFGIGQEELRLPQRETSPRHKEDDQYHCSQRQVVSRSPVPTSRDVVHDRSLRIRGNVRTHAEELYDVYEPTHDQLQDRSSSKRIPVCKEDSYGYNKQQGRGIRRRHYVRNRDDYELPMNRAWLHAPTAESEPIYECIDAVNENETNEDIYDSAL